MLDRLGNCFVFIHVRFPVAFKDEGVVFEECQMNFVTGGVEGEGVHGGIEILMRKSAGVMLPCFFSLIHLFYRDPFIVILENFFVGFAILCHAEGAAAGHADAVAG